MTWIALACLLALTNSAFGRSTYGSSYGQQKIPSAREYSILPIQQQDASVEQKLHDDDEVPVQDYGATPLVSQPDQHQIEFGPWEDVCASQPCLNGGQCLQTDSSYQCQCASGFDGEDCGLDARVCQTQQPCGQSPDARCQSFRLHSALPYICILEDGHAYGLNAQQAEPSPCQGVDGKHALLVSEKGFIMCDDEYMFVESCPGGTIWDDVNKACTWPDMQTDAQLHQQQQDHPKQILTNTELGPLKNVCTSQPCLNGGQCLQTDSSYQCQCAPGFDGQNCGLDARVCQTQQPCGQSLDVRCQSFRLNSALPYICIFQDGLAYGLNAQQAEPSPCQGVDGVHALLVSEKGFIMCYGEDMFVESCPGGTIWDDVNKACTWPDMQTNAQLDQQQDHEQSSYGQQKTMNSESVYDI